VKKFGTAPLPSISEYLNASQY